MNCASKIQDLDAIMNISYQMTILYTKVGGQKKRDDCANLFLLAQKEITAKEGQSCVAEVEVLEPHVLLV